MWRRLALAVLWVLVASALLVGVGVADPVDPELEDATGTVEVVVRLEPLPTAAPTEDELEAHAEETQEVLLTYERETPGVEVNESFWLANMVVLTVDTDTVDLVDLVALEGVDAVHENFEVVTHGVHPQASVRPTWGLERVGAPLVWDAYDTRGEGVRVAVLDSGVDAAHPDIDLHTDNPSDPTFPGGWAAFGERGERLSGVSPHDSGTHGTHVTGTLAGGGASGVHVGVAPGATVLHGQVIDGDRGTFAQLVAGMEWAVEREAHVISMSIGSSGHVRAFVEPVQNARAAGSIVVASVGNGGHGTSSSPANVHEAIGVGATDRTDAAASFSGGELIWTSGWANPPPDWPNAYLTPDVAAPGVAVSSTLPGGEYGELSGSSMATPHVSGTIALMLSVAPEASADEVTAALFDSADHPGGMADDRLGHGVVDAPTAVTTLVERTGGEPIDLGERRPVTPARQHTVPGGPGLALLSPDLAVLVAVATLAIGVRTRRGQKR